MFYFFHDLWIISFLYEHLFVKSLVIWLDVWLSQLKTTKHNFVIVVQSGSFAPLPCCKIRSKQRFTINVYFTGDWFTLIREFFGPHRAQFLGKIQSAQTLKNDVTLRSGYFLRKNAACEGPSFCFFLRFTHKD